MCFCLSHSGQAQSQFGSFFSSPCQQTGVSIPSITPEWTCGLNLSGTFNCSGKHCHDMSNTMELHEPLPCPEKSASVHGQSCGNNKGRTYNHIQHRKPLSAALTTNPRLEDLLSRQLYMCAVSSGKIVGSSGSSTYVSNGPGRVQSINVGNGGSSVSSSIGASPSLASI